MSSKKFKKRSTETKQGIPTAALPDIIFMLLIFFMVVTVLREVEVEVRTILPEAEAVQTIEQRRLVSYIWIGPERLSANEFGETKVQIDDALIESPDIGSIRDIMYRQRQEEPRIIVSLRVDSDAEMGIVKDVEQELRHANTLRINYSTHEQN